MPHGYLRYTLHLSVQSLAPFCVVEDCDNAKAHAGVGVGDEQQPSGIGPSPIVPAIYAAITDPTLWPEILASVCDEFDAAVGILGTYDFATRRATRSASVGISKPFIESYSGTFAKSNPWAHESQLRIPGTIRTGSELIADDELLATDFYTGWLAPQHLFHSIRAVLHREHRKIWIVGMIRHQTYPDFGAADTDRLAALVPHFRRAFKIDRALTQRAAIADSTLAAFDQLPFGIALLSSDGRVLAANIAAQRLTAERDGIAFTPDGISARRAADKAKLMELVASIRSRRAGTAASGHTFTIDRTDHRRPLSLRVSRPSNAMASFGDHVAAATVVINDPERRLTPDTALLRSVYKLTPAEARVTAALATGTPLPEVAKLLGISYETARTHLKRTFGKTETSRQADLIRLVQTDLAPIEDWANTNDLG